MLLSDWYYDRREKRIRAAKATAKAAAKATAKAAAKATAKAEGIAEGRAEAYREIADWDLRRREAAARGEEFSEPPPGVTQNGSK